MVVRRQSTISTFVKRLDNGTLSGSGYMRMNTMEELLMENSLNRMVGVEGRGADRSEVAVERIGNGRSISEEPEKVVASLNVFQM